MKYFFISFQRKTSCEEQWRFAQQVVDIHPFEWLKQAIKLINEQVIIMYYKEIDVEEFLLYKKLFEAEET